MEPFKASISLTAVAAAGLWSGSLVLAQQELPLDTSETAPPPAEAGINGPEERAPLPDGPEATESEAKLPEEYDVLARGPLHEAFASPYTSNPSPSEVVREEPPEPIQELPPEAMPEGEGIVWIPGYWGWEPAENAFVWISGLWREAPPGRRWIPGYWIEAEEGFQRISGFWAEASERRIVYLPEPPPAPDNGPNRPPPSQDSVWLPGCWIWQGDDYEWRPGYWTPIAPGWVWVPDQYRWTPHGYIFVAGYWDRPLDERGLMFAPVVYREPIYTQPDYTYVPQVAVNTTPLLMHLFASPGYGHYYYGDYYGFEPQGAAFFPWYSYSRRTALYDPLLAYYQWRYATRGIDLVRRLTGWNDYFVSNAQFRPPRTFRAQREFLTSVDVDRAPIDLSSVVLTDTFDDLLRSNSLGRNFTQVAADRRDFLRNASRDLRQFQQQRRDFEATVAQSGENAPLDAQQLDAQQRGDLENQADPRQENAFPLPENLFLQDSENPAITGDLSAGDEDPATADNGPGDRENPATAGEDPAGENENPATAGTGSPNNDNPATAASGRRGPRDVRPPARPEPIQPNDGEESARGENRTTNPATAADQPGEPGENRTTNPATATERPDSPNATERPDAPNATERPDAPNAFERPDAPNAFERSDNPATPGANRPGVPTADGAGANENPRFPRFGVGPRNRGMQNQPGAAGTDNTGAANETGANRPGFVLQNGMRPRGDNLLNRMPPGMQPGSNPAAPGQQPGAGQQMRPPAREVNPGAAQRAPRPQQPAAQRPNVQPRTPNPGTGTPGADRPGQPGATAAPGGNTGQAPAGG